MMQTGTRFTACDRDAVNQLCDMYVVCTLYLWWFQVLIRCTSYTFTAFIAKWYACYFLFMNTLVIIYFLN